MNRLSFILAYRYLSGTRKHKQISIMVLICFLGITIGSFALAVVASVMNGFEKTTHEKMQSIHPQIIMDAEGKELDIKKITTVLQQEFPSISSCSPVMTKQGIIQEDEDDTYSIVMLQGVSPNTHTKVSNLETKIIESVTPEKTLQSILHNNMVIIGKKLAEQLDLTIGDNINLLFAPDETVKRKKISLEQKESVIGGIFKTGIDEFDSALVICSLDMLHTLFPKSGPSQIYMQLNKNSNEQEVANNLKKRFGLQIYSWKQLYPALVEALKLEKYAMFFILALIILVASMNIISLLFMQITQKRGDIAILKAMGFANAGIEKIFLYIGTLIAIAGSMTGLILAYIAGYILETYPFITLPDAYYVTHLPCRMDWSIFVAVFAVVIVLSFFSTWLPARKTRTINISEVLRFEG